MGIPAKQHYRFVFLRSEKWKDVRVEALFREDATCQICGEISISNDAHHISYPASVWDTCPDDLVILCRPCHVLAESVLKASPDREKSFYEFQQIVAALKQWLANKRDFLKERAFLKKSERWLPPRMFGACYVCRELKDTIKPVQVGVILGCLKIEKPWLLCAECHANFKSTFDQQPKPVLKPMLQVKRWKEQLQREKFLLTQ